MHPPARAWAAGVMTSAPSGGGGPKFRCAHSERGRCQSKLRSNLAHEPDIPRVLRATAVAVAGHDGHRDGGVQAMRKGYADAGFALEEPGAQLPGGPARQRWHGRVGDRDRGRDAAPRLAEVGADLRLESAHLPPPI